ncbi:uncharacterized protein LOC117816511 [Xyrichtys novacula]|uniref:Uncharacterized protein LOC117816511 n=1 Tax=Xyrichtys novacula TaxID=13765 RepID=A0AAV1ETD9_XYRNO|nr:uncharacterized protein LOC117816511 [Xyrichtys novacula]
MVGFFHAFVAVLSLLSMGQSAPVTSCNTQTVEIQGRDQILGKWTLIAEATNDPGAKMMSKVLVESSWIRFTAANESNAIEVLQGEKLFGRCFTLKTKMTLENGTLTMGSPLNSSTRLLSTGCPDCLVLYTQYFSEGSTNGGVQFMSRRNIVTAAELEELKKLVECLNFPSPVILNQDKGLCPEDSPLNTDLTSDFYDMSPDFFNQTESIISDEAGMDGLSDLISSLSDLTDT